MSTRVFWENASSQYQCLIQRTKKREGEAERTARIASTAAVETGTRIDEGSVRTTSGLTGLTGAEADPEIRTGGPGKQCTTSCCVAGHLKLVDGQVLADRLHVSELWKIYLHGCVGLGLRRRLPAAPHL